MSGHDMKCIIKCNDMQHITTTVIYDCYASYFRIKDVNGIVMVYNTSDMMDDVMILSENHQLFVEPLPPYTDTLVNYLEKYKRNFLITSSNREFLNQLYMKDPTLLLGAVENTYFELNPQDYYISFVFLKYSTDAYDRMKEYRYKHRDVKVYFTGVSNESDIQRCITAKANGILILPSRIQNTQKIIKLCSQKV